MDQHEMLTAREQLMWDIDGIVEEFACNIAPRISEDDMEDLIKTLCDSVCKNFPVAMPSTDRGQDSAFMDDNFGG